MDNKYDVAVGQKWRSCDKRDQGKVVRVIEVGETHAVVSTGFRKSRVRLDRFRPNSTGWERIA